MRQWMRPTVIAVILLAALGVAAGVLRTARAAMGLSRPDAAVAYDSAYMRFIFRTSLIPPADPRHAEMETNFTVGERKYDVHPAATLLHVVPGVLFMILGPLQLIPAIRARRPALHRWSGRLLLLTGACIAGSALFVAWVAPGAGTRESVLITVIALFFMVSGARAWFAIRQGRRAEHREWMIRFLATALAISTVRLISFPIAILTGGISITTAFIMAMAAGWALTLGAAEWWIRRTRVATRHAMPLEPVAVHR